jgi:pimeloyl-ACP methyl ester carboxylesterase
MGRVVRAGCVVGKGLCRQWHRQEEVMTILDKAKGTAERVLEQALTDSRRVECPAAPTWPGELLRGLVEIGNHSVWVTVIRRTTLLASWSASSAPAPVDLRDVLPSIDVPTLLLYGDADQRSSLYVAQDLQAQIKGSTLAVIPGAGHLSNVDAPDRFNAEVRRFLRAH